LVQNRFADTGRAPVPAESAVRAAQRKPLGREACLCRVRRSGKELDSLRAGRQILNYNNTIFANSEWRDQGRSFDAVAANLQYSRYRLAIFAASVVTPLTSGISHHQEGNNVYGLYGGIDGPLSHSTLEPFILWRVQPSVAIVTTAKTKTGKQDEQAYGMRYKGVAARTLDYSYEAIIERGTDGPKTPAARGRELCRYGRSSAPHGPTATACPRRKAGREWF
jgi:hypothetical protein